MADKASTEETTTEVKDAPKTTGGRKILKTAFRLLVVLPGVYMASELGQLLAVTYLIGLAVPLPVAGWRIGLGGWAALNVAKYLTRTAVAQATGKPQGAFAQSAALFRGAVDEMTREMTKKSRPSGAAAAIRKLEPEQMERLVQGLGALKAAKGTTAETVKAEDAAPGLYL